MANNNETTPTAPINACNNTNNQPALSERYEPKIRSEKGLSNPKTPPQVSKNSRSKRGAHRRTHSAGGEDVSRSSSSLKKITGAVGGSPSKKVEALLNARFERLSDMDRVRRVRLNSERITKVLILLCYIANFHSK